MLEHFYVSRLQGTDNCRRWNCFQSPTLPPNCIISDKPLSDEGKIKLVLMGLGGCWMFPSEVKFNLFEK